jgi:PST family polysaccharide transporter
VIASKLVYTVCIFIFIRDVDNFLFLPISLGISNSCAVFLTWYELLKKMQIRIKIASLKKTFDFLHDSSVFFLSSIAVSIYTVSNTIILGMKYPSASLAQYGAANSLIANMRALLSPISNSIYPYMVANKNYKLVKKIIWLLMPVIVLGCAGLYVFAKPIIVFICGNDYSNAVPIFKAMLPLVIISLPTYLLGYPVMGAIGRINIANISVMMGALFHIIGLVLLYTTGIMSFINIALLTGLTELVVFSIRLTVVIRYFKRNGI